MNGIGSGCPADLGAGTAPVPWESFLLFKREGTRADSLRAVSALYFLREFTEGAPDGEEMAVAALKRHGDLRIAAV